MELIELLVCQSRKGFRIACYDFWFGKLSFFIPEEFFERWIDDIDYYFENPNIEGIRHHTRELNESDSRLGM